MLAALLWALFSPKAKFNAQRITSQLAMSVNEKNLSSSLSALLSSPDFLPHVLSEPEEEPLTGR